jgi:predicted nucleotidyltransferase
MRLEPEEIVAIKAAALRAFEAGAVVRLFGSRVDDAKRGGDIDLFIETSFAGDAAYDAEKKFLLDLQDMLGERRIDVVTHTVGQPLSPISRIAKAEGVVLLGEA